jgi:hypothetical protein
MVDKLIALRFTHEEMQILLSANLILANNQLFSRQELDTIACDLENYAASIVGKSDAEVLSSILCLADSLCELT